MAKKRRKQSRVERPATGTLTMPAYMARFRCVGSACENTCCGSWAIPIDHASYERYQRASDPELGPRLRRHVVRAADSNEREWAHFALTPVENTCHFLTEGHLCELHTRHGAGFLCATCAVYPRVSMLVDGQRFQAGDISCPEVARLALLDPTAMRPVKGNQLWDTRQTLAADITTATAGSGDPMALFAIIREHSVALLKQRQVTLETRLAALGMAMEELSRTSGEQAWTTEAGRDKLTAGSPLFERDVRAAFDRQTKDLIDLQARLSRLPQRYDIPVGLLSGLTVGRFFGPGASARYVDQVAAIYGALGLPPRRASLKQAMKVYARAYAQTYAPYVAGAHHVMENFLINQIYASAYPFLNGRSLLDEYVMFLARYALVKAHLVGAAAARGELTDALVIEVVHVLARALDHTIPYQNHVLSLIEPHTRSVDGLLSLVVA